MSKINRNKKGNMGATYKPKENTSSNEELKNDGEKKTVVTSGDKDLDETIKKLLNIHQKHK